MDAGMEQTKIFEAHYPESVRRFFVINGAPIRIFIKFIL